MKKTLYVLMLLQIFIVTACAQEIFDSYLENAERFIKKEDYLSAIAELKKALTASTGQRQEAKAMNAIGWSYFSINDLVNARLYLNKAYDIAVKEDNADLARLAANNLGIVEYTNENFETAKEYFNSPWAKGSDTASKYLEIMEKRNTAAKVNSLIAAGVTYRFNKEFDKAVIEYQKALEIDPKDERALEYMGYSFYRLENYEQAIEYSKKAYAINPSRINVIINLMKTYCKMGAKNSIRDVCEQNKQLLSKQGTLLKEDVELSSACKPLNIEFCY